MQDSSQQIKDTTQISHASDSDTKEARPAAVPGMEEATTAQRPIATSTSPSIVPPPSASPASVPDIDPSSRKPSPKEASASPFAHALPSISRDECDRRADRSPSPASKRGRFDGDAINTSERNVDLSVKNGLCNEAIAPVDYGVSGNASHLCTPFTRGLSTDPQKAATINVPNDDSVAPNQLHSPTKKLVQHESTLLTLNPTSSSLRSFPITSFDEELLSPIPAGLPEIAPGELLPIVYGSAQACGLRAYMEDRSSIFETLFPQSSQPGNSAIVPNSTLCSFAGVYDGHNGVSAADHAAQQLHQLIQSAPAVQEAFGNGPPVTLAREAEGVSSALIKAFEKVDDEILAQSKSQGGRSGATAVVVLQIGETVYAAHCGDSRAVLCRNGEPLRLTEDHKPNLPRERKRVEGMGGRVDFARCWRVIVDPGGGRPASGLAVSRSFGDLDFKEPLHLVIATPDVMNERLLTEDEFIILASDGLWDVLTDNEACDIVRRKIQSADANNFSNDRILATLAAEALVQASLDAGTMDNVTAVVGILRWK